MKTTAIHMNDDVPSIQNFVEVVLEYLSTVDIVNVLSRRTGARIVINQVDDLRTATEALQSSLQKYNSYSSDSRTSSASADDLTDPRMYNQDPRTAHSALFPAPSQVPEPRRLDFRGIPGNSEWIPGDGIWENIPCDYTAHHNFCRWCTLPQSDSWFFNHDTICEENPRNANGKQRGYEIEVCDFCKYIIPSSLREEHLEMCVYNGEEYQVEEELPGESRLLTAEEIASQDDSDPDNPAYLSHSCFGCYDSGTDSECDRTFGCQNCRAREALCIYDLGEVKFSVDTRLLGRARLTYDDIDPSKGRVACEACRESRRTCRWYGIEPCLYCVEHNCKSCKFIHNAEIKGTVEYCSPFYAIYDDNKLMEIRKQRQALAIAHEHCDNASAAARRKREEGKKAEQIEEQAKSVEDTERTKKNKQTKTKAGETTTRNQETLPQQKTAVAGSNRQSLPSSDAGIATTKASKQSTADDKTNSEQQGRHQNDHENIATGLTQEPGTAQPLTKKRNATDTLSEPAKRAKTSDDASADPSHSALGDPTGLPSGWYAKQAENGRTYHQNSNTRTTTWEKPT